MKSRSIKVVNSLFIAKAVFALLIAVTFSMPTTGLYAQVKVSGDPMVKITSLPIDQEISKILALISKDVSDKTGLDETFITYYWQYFEYIHCPGLAANDLKCPIFVDLYTPAFMSKEEIQTVMKSVAAALEKHTDYSQDEIFIHTHIAEKHQLFINGDVVTNWSQVGGPDE
ncbi:MAG: hypothetical protein GQ527_09320 [Bacteroidales bacterium]|nr:hypothetical protein [Bacteroidales bacterium]